MRKRTFDWLGGFKLSSFDCFTFSRASTFTSGYVEKKDSREGCGLYDDILHCLNDHKFIPK